MVEKRGIKDYYIRGTFTSNNIDFSKDALDFYNNGFKSISIEPVVTSEEMAKAIDLGDFFRIPADNRDLNYDKFVTEGSSKIEDIEPYTSHNTARLDVEGMKRELLRIIEKEVHDELRR